MLVRLIALLSFAALALGAFLAIDRDPAPLQIEAHASGRWDFNQAAIAKPPLDAPPPPDAFAWRGQCLRNPGLIYSYKEDDT